MRIKELFADFEYTVVSGSDEQCQVNGIEYDSREIKEGELFVCIKGFNADGHDFAVSAYQKGCRAFLCQRKLDLPEDAFQAVCADTGRDIAYAAAAFYGYPSKKLTLIGITGTKGKTSTAILIRSVLEGNGISTAYIGTNGMMIRDKLYDVGATTPESLVLNRCLAQMVSEGMTHAVMEVSSQALMMKRVEGIDFDTCVFTNLSPDHIGAFEHASYEAYRDDKKKLFTEHNCRNIVYNMDDPEAGYMVKGTSAKLVSCSISDGSADYLGKEYTMYRDDDSLGISFTSVHRGHETPVKMCTPGEFTMQNGLLAMAVGQLYGVSGADVSKVLATAVIDGRFELVKGLPGRIFVVDYAHNDVSLTSAINALRKYNPKRIICVFGSVGGRTQLRRARMGKIASELADYSIITSDNPDFESPEKICEDIAACYDESKQYEVIVNRYEAVKRAVDMAEEGDIVLFAGKGHETYDIRLGKKVPYCERDVVRNACREAVERHRSMKDIV